MSGLLVQSMGLIALATTLLLNLCPAYAQSARRGPVIAPETVPRDDGREEQAVSGQDSETRAEPPAIQPPSGPTDAELRGEQPRRSWLPPEETGLGMPQGATGGGFPDRSMRTGTFGSDTGIPGAGGTRAGR